MPWALLLLGALAAKRAGDAPARAADVKLVPHTTASHYERTHEKSDLDAWYTRVPGVRAVSIKTSSDGDEQPAVWYDSNSKRKKPLLVVLHSWSADYEQNINIPFAEFAIKNDWVFVHPNFRGPNRRPEATASELAINDVIDAVDYARKQAEVDPRRIYLVGYSGGAMKALVLAGKHPELWAGVVAFGGIYDIPDWYRHNRGRNPVYRREIAASCGGAPRPGSPAEAECRERSPITVLDGAAGKVPILLAHGIRDDVVPPRHALYAFDALAAPEDRFSDAERAVIDKEGTLPANLRPPPADPIFEQAGLPIRLRRQSRSVTLVLYKGGHDMIYNAALRWLADRSRS